MEADAGSSREGASEYETRNKVRNMMQRGGVKQTGKAPEESELKKQAQGSWNGTLQR